MKQMQPCLLPLCWSCLLFNDLGCSILLSVWALDQIYAKQVLCRTFVPGSLQSI